MPTTASRSGDHVPLRPPFLVLLVLGVLCAVSVGLWSAAIGPAGRARVASALLRDADAARSALWRTLGRDTWTGFVETGDRLAARGALTPDGLSARTAYLLAFHKAQDSMDVPRMRVVADRLERLGEHALAEHVRRRVAELEGNREPPLR